MPERQNRMQADEAGHETHKDHDEAAKEELIPVTIW